MKKLFIIITLSAAVSACTDFDIADQGFQLENLPGYVSFGNTGGTTDPAEKIVNEGSDATFRLYVPTNALSDITVNYSLSGTATFGADFTIAGANATGGSIILRYDNRLSDGQRDVNDFAFVELVVTTLTDATVDPDETVIITLTSASNSEKEFAVGRGGTEIQRTATVTITDN